MCERKIRYELLLFTQTWLYMEHNGVIVSERYALVST
jgi:hypothetical protein